MCCVHRGEDGNTMKLKWRTYELSSLAVQKSALTVQDSLAGGQTSFYVQRALGQYRGGSVPTTTCASSAPYPLPLPLPPPHRFPSTRP